MKEKLKVVNFNFSPSKPHSITYCQQDDDGNISWNNQNHLTLVYSTNLCVKSNAVNVTIGLPTFTTNFTTRMKRCEGMCLLLTCWRDACQFLQSNYNLITKPCCSKPTPDTVVNWETQFFSISHFRLFQQR